jgi:hypothetical protein
MMPINNKMDAGALYIPIGRLIESMPDLVNAALNSEIQKWLGDAYALVEVSGDLMVPVGKKIAINTFIDCISINTSYSG